MYSAKARGIGHEVYSASRDGHSRARLALIGELPEAITNGQIVTYYQPKFELATSGITGAERSCAGTTRTGCSGQAPSAARRATGLMRAHAARARRRARRCALDRRGLNLTVAVNLSAANLLDLDLPGDDGAARQARRHPALLQLEITETIVAATRCA
jgi:EAL domain-containing protein (putative c-di-GMP-specific phosphodiesterase class I)